MTRGEPLDVGRLRLLREVGRRGSIAAAARAVGLTASAVSQQLAQLERDAGAPLLDRSPRGVVLTGAGEALAERAAQVLDLLGSAAVSCDATHVVAQAVGDVTYAVSGTRAVLDHHSGHEAVSL